MQFLVKLLITVGIIIISSQIGKRFPSLAGLIATMPLTGLLVLIWLYSENPGDRGMMIGYTKGAVFGIVPSILFYLVAWACFSRGYGMPAALGAGFAVWTAGALLHQLLLG